VKVGGKHEGWEGEKGGGGDEGGLKEGVEGGGGRGGW